MIKLDTALYLCACLKTGSDSHVFRDAKNRNSIQGKRSPESGGLFHYTELDSDFDCLDAAEKGQAQFLKQIFIHIHSSVDNGFLYTNVLFCKGPLSAIVCIKMGVMSIFVLYCVFTFLECPLMLTWEHQLKR